MIEQERTSNFRTQEDRVLEFLLNGQTLTSREAKKEPLGVRYLAAVIGNLKKKGHDIVTEYYDTESETRRATYRLRSAVPTLVFDTLDTSDTALRQSELPEAPPEPVETSRDRALAALAVGTQLDADGLVLSITDERGVSQQYRLTPEQARYLAAAFGGCGFCSPERSIIG